MMGAFPTALKRTTTEEMLSLAEGEDMGLTLLARERTFGGVLLLVRV